jgi:hypothetical protein
VAFTPLAGSAGRLKAAVAAADLDAVLPTLTGLNTAALAGVRRWRISPEMEGAGGITHFEIAANDAGVLFQEQLQGGTGRFSIEVELIFDAQVSGGSDVFIVGQFFVLDLIFSRYTTLGRYGTVGKVMNFEQGPSVEDGSKGQIMSVRLDGHGVPPPVSIPS